MQCAVKRKRFFTLPFRCSDRRSRNTKLQQWRLREAQSEKRRLELATCPGVAARRKPAPPSVIASQQTGTENVAKVSVPHRRLAGPTTNARLRPSRPGAKSLRPDP